MADQFDWNSVVAVIRQVDAIAVYANDDGDIVIRQKNALGEEDHAVYFPVSQAKAVIDGIKAATGK